MIQCDKLEELPKIQFNIGNSTFIMNGNNYVFPWQFFPNKTDCVTVFAKQESQNMEDPAGLHNPQKNTWIFGVPFMGTYYTEFDYAKKRVGFAEAKKFKLKY